LPGSFSDLTPRKNGPKLKNKNQEIHGERFQGGDGFSDYFSSEKRIRMISVCI
jgi:hypothetical protein